MLKWILTERYCDGFRGGEQSYVFETPDDLLDFEDMMVLPLETIEEIDLDEDEIQVDDELTYIFECVSFSPRDYCKANRVRTIKERLLLGLVD